MSPISEQHQDACEPTSATLPIPNFRYPRSRFRIVSRSGCAFAQSLKVAIGDTALHGASARFGGRHGCDEGVRLNARMYGLPLVFLSFERPVPRYLQAARSGNRPNRDGASDGFVKRRPTIPNQNTFLRNATERRHWPPMVSQESSEVGPLSEVTTVSIVESVHRLCRRCPSRLPFFVRPRSPMHLSMRPPS